MFLPNTGEGEGDRSVFLVSSACVLTSPQLRSRGGGGGGFGLAEIGWMAQEEEEEEEEEEHDDDSGRKEEEEGGDGDLNELEGCEGRECRQKK